MARRLDACNKILLELKRECETYQILGSISHFALQLMNVMSGLEKLMEENEHIDEEVLEFYFHEGVLEYL